MKIVDLYGWGLPKPADFLEPFKNNDAMYNQARLLWSKLDQTTIWFLIVFIVLAFILSFVYYGPYNNKPHRHYRVKCWLMWMMITVASSFVVSFVVGLIMIQSPLDARASLFCRISFVNAVYSAILYFIISALVCNLPFVKTNAYRFLKIGK